MSKIRNAEILSLYRTRLTGKCATQKLKKLWTCLHHMVILRSQNKNTDFVKILA